ncbi:hypothetical protein DYB26_007007 [Aphanomyces astaci]|uniref:Uncharacterized protein n=1 Tax=Aphanomyces astaci TaxID=112090 RepID=A0A3R7A199_APHAT|nr:hypothetical protein DYB26_007007 [Aphanomyces astaci]
MDVDPWSLERNFLTLQSCLREVIGCAGGNSYKIPHMKKAALKKFGRLPESVSCGKDVCDDGCTLLGQDLYKREHIPVPVEYESEMKDIFQGSFTMIILN